MSYQAEHKRMKPVLDVARLLDIAANPEKKAIFEPEAPASRSGVPRTIIQKAGRE
jgi:hypothetical protein